MASKTRSIKLPADLCDVAEDRAKKLGYPSYNAYIKGLIRYDALCQGPHSITLPWASLPLPEQDKIDAKLLKCTQEGVGQRGQLLKRIVQGTDSVKVAASATKASGAKAPPVKEDAEG